MRLDAGALDLADIEWVQMAERIKILPLVVAAVLAILGLVVYLVAGRSRAHVQNAATSEPAASPARSASAPADRGPVEAPPISRSPGDKILEGADGAFSSGMFPTALMFYKDFELRYAGTEVYDRNVQRVWERIHTSNASIEKSKQDPTIGAYLESRRKLAGEWSRIKPLLAGAHSAESGAQARKYLDSLPPQDGRRKILEEWLGSSPGEK